jgi:hypothetical protein
MRLLSIALPLAVVAGAAQAQTYDPAQSQQRLNQLQMDIQTQQLQRAQRQTLSALVQSDPAIRMQAAQTQAQIQRQIDATQALRQQAPSASPADINARLQTNGAEIQQIPGVR